MPYNLTRQPEGADIFEDRNRERFLDVIRIMEGRMEIDKRLKSEIENLKMRVINEEWRFDHKI